MRKRSTAGLVALTAAVALSGGVVAHAEDYRVANDKKPPKPCNPYPPGKKFYVTAAPSNVTIKKNSNVNVYSTVSRGEGSDRKPCQQHLVALRYESRPGKTIQAHRTADNGSIGFVAGPIPGTLHYYFDMLYAGSTTSSNHATIYVK